MPRLRLMLSYQVCNQLFENAPGFMKTMQTFLFRQAHKPRDISNLDIFRRESYGQRQSRCELNNWSAVRCAWAISFWLGRWVVCGVSPAEKAMMSSKDDRIISKVGLCEDLAPSRVYMRPQELWLHNKK